ncbi:MAG: nucleotidyltransferase family protein [Deltaproteobacteria bacterium]|nr:nucleotidyltransferase family protein [Deltaproteobacteria bacterium]
MKSRGQRVAGIILAAGASTRMGKPKQLLPVHGQTLLGLIIDEALKSDLDKVFLVLGHHAEEIRAALGKTPNHPKLKVIENSLYKKGISTSIRAGLSKAEEDHDNVMILLADMPHIDARLINLLLQRFLKSCLPLGAVSIKGKRSHPVIFGRKLYHELHQLKGDVGARELFLRYGEQVCLVEPEGFYDDRDIDTLKDYISHSVSQIP